VIRLRLADLLAERGWTPYRLARETGLTIPTAYRLADVSLRFGRFTADTLDRLCEALRVQPGELLEWVPDTPARRKAARDGATRSSSTPTRRPAGAALRTKRAKTPLKRNS
jgi:DNA-binding Xre family transcriptional regulator